MFSMLGVINNLYIGLISFNTIPVHAILIYLFLIISFKPYRKHVTKLMKRWIMMKASETASTTEGTSKTGKGLNQRRLTLKTDEVKHAWT